MIAHAEKVTVGHLIRAVGVYALARLLLVVALTMVISLGGQALGRDVALFVAAGIAVLISLPLSLAVFAPLRRRVNATIVAFEAQRQDDGEAAQTAS